MTRQDWPWIVLLGLVCGVFLVATICQMIFC